MIEIKNLKKVWEDTGAPVLEDINLTIEDGEIYALVGRSGAGKSTLLRCINGLTSYQEGSLKVDGHEGRSALIAFIQLSIGRSPTPLYASVSSRWSLCQPVW